MLAMESLLIRPAWMLGGASLGLLTGLTEAEIWVDSQAITAIVGPYAVPLVVARQVSVCQGHDGQGIGIVLGRQAASVSAKEAKIHGHDAYGNGLSTW
jgi:hypothetical protein